MDLLWSLVGLSPAGLAFGVAAVLLGAFIKGSTGFGASMVWVTSLSLVLPPLQVVPMVLMFEVITSVRMLLQPLATSLAVSPSPASIS